MVTASCLGAAPATAGTGATPADEAPAPTVSVSAAGSVSVEPDLAVVNLAVEATTDSADAADDQPFGPEDSCLIRPIHPRWW